MILLKTPLSISRFKLLTTCSFENCLVSEKQETADLLFSTAIVKTLLF